ncbi:acetate/propionate family kinase [Mesorhizobium sp. INR15]|uniref:acetate/propionate family kinase n=1 Tax=Mesorhizobium sp. INR15 TaxID=2654248 RepID=UPI001896684A|nr:acetate/propionate family kinase [Mesorhizobium sp. INR15]QPC91634.1 acetate/propionate family kinase [Mesorhizobium sp. INR15]
MTEAKPNVVVLTLNSGSSSLKFGLYRVDASRTEMLLAGEAESIGGSNSKFHATDAHGTRLPEVTGRIADQREAVIRVGRLLAGSEAPAPDAVGHRIVHGGPNLRRRCLIDDAVLQQLEAAIPFAPLHMPPALSVIKFAREHFPNLPQAASFDTTFHADLPDIARVLPVPKELRAEGIQRYGFHGLSCASILHQLGGDLPERVIIAHLGNGASITAVRGGKSIDTSMGLTPTGGVIMGTRSGDLDPGLLVYLMREKKLDAPMLEDLLDHHSGLLGISGLSGDMRQLHKGTASDARLAIEMFCYSVRKQIAAMNAALNGVDLIVFTGGIGENDGNVRAEICAGLSWNGVRLDETRNSSNACLVSDPASRCKVMVLPSQEDEQIGRDAWALLDASRPNG